MPGINPLTAENLVDDTPLDYDEYATAKNTFSVLAFDAFNPATNFRDPGDPGVIIQGAGNAATAGEPKRASSSSLEAHRCISVKRWWAASGSAATGVDQDDVVTFAGQAGFAPIDAVRVDQFPVGNVRLPFQKFNRNPFLL